MTNLRKFWIVCSVLLLLGFTFRLAIARYLAVDDPDDGKVYSQLARNLLTQKIYSHATESPYQPSLIRVPGYPLFLAGVYWLFGEGNDSAVRITQVLLDMGTCALIALIAFYWEPDDSRKHATAIAALALATVCPFSAIYTATILTESATIFLAVSMSLTATLAFRALTIKHSISLWSATGIIAGVAILFRPDSGLFALAIAITLVGEILQGRNIRRLETVEPLETEEPLEAEQPLETEEPIKMRRRLSRAVVLGAVFTAATCLVLAPWTIRNYRVFHFFQPLAPRHARMPGEFVPYGYFAWLRTWMQDQRYLGPALLKLDQAPIDVDEIPDQAFDSLEEKNQVAALFEKYSYPSGITAAPDFSSETGENESHSETPTARSNSEDFDLNDPEKLPDELPPGLSAEHDQVEESQPVKMTLEIDGAFARIAQERISRSPIRYYLSLPFRRAVSLWFDTHSQYFPFEGELMPLEELDKSTNQQIWLPLFAALTWIYTLSGIAGAWLLWRTRDFETRRWVILVGLIVFLRLGFFATLENPEPRYVIEIFPFLSILGGITAGRIATLRIRDWYKGKGVKVQ